MVWRQTFPGIRVTESIPNGVWWMAKRLSPESPRRITGDYQMHNHVEIDKGMSISLMDTCDGWLKEEPSQTQNVSRIHGGLIRKWPSTDSISSHLHENCILVIFSNGLLTLFWINLHPLWLTTCGNWTALFRCNFHHLRAQTTYNAPFSHLEPETSAVHKEHLLLDRITLFWYLFSLRCSYDTQITLAMALQFLNNAAKSRSMALVVNVISCQDGHTAYYRGLFQHMIDIGLFGRIIW